MHLPTVRIQRTPPERHTLRKQELPQVRDTHGGSTLLKPVLVAPGTTGPGRKRLREEGAKEER